MGEAKVTAQSDLMMNVDEISREQILIEAAYALLDQEGLEGLTIRAVLARTGLARRAFYDSFAGKDDLVLAVFAKTLQLAAAHFGRQIAVIDDPVERMHKVVTGIVLGRVSMGFDSDGGRRSAALSREHLRLAEARPTELQAALTPLIDLITEELERGMDAGVFRRAPAQRLALLVYNLLSTTVHSEILAEEGSAPDRARRIELAEDIWHFCHRAIAA